MSRRSATATTRFAARRASSATRSPSRQPPGGLLLVPPAQHAVSSRAGMAGRSAATSTGPRGPGGAGAGPGPPGHRARGRPSLTIEPSTQGVHPRTNVLYTVNGVLDRCSPGQVARWRLLSTAEGKFLSVRLTAMTSACSRGTVDARGPESTQDLLLSANAPSAGKTGAPHLPTDPVARVQPAPRCAGHVGMARPAADAGAAGAPILTLIVEEGPEMLCPPMTADAPIARRAPSHGRADRGPGVLDFGVDGRRSIRHDRRTR
jgi:hypothetical protein